MASEPSRRERYNAPTCPNRDGGLCLRGIHDRAGGTLEYGLSLGRFSSKEAAERELANLGNKGVRTARVIQERPESPGFTLRLPAVTDALRPQFDALRSAMAGKTLRNCA